MEDVYGDGKNITNLERIHELEEMVSELESKNAKLREQLNAVVDAILHHRFQAESDVSLNVINYKLWDETAEQQKRRRAEIRKNRRGE